MTGQKKPVTRLEVLKTLFPEVEVDGAGYPTLCVNYFRKGPPCDGACCWKCQEEFWDAPAPEQFQKEA